MTVSVQATQGGKWYRQRTYLVAVTTPLDRDEQRGFEGVYCVVSIDLERAVVEDVRG